MISKECCKKCKSKLNGNPDLGFVPQCSMFGNCPCHNPMSNLNWEQEFDNFYESLESGIIDNNKEAFKKFFEELLSQSRSQTIEEIKEKIEKIKIKELPNGSDPYKLYNSGQYRFRNDLLNSLK